MSNEGGSSIRVKFTDVEEYEEYIEQAVRTYLAEHQSYAEDYDPEEHGESFSEHLGTQDVHDPFQQSALNGVSDEVDAIDLFNFDNPASWGLAIYFSRVSERYTEVYFDVKEYVHENDPFETLKSQAKITVMTDFMVEIERLVDEYRPEQ